MKVNLVANKYFFPLFWLMLKLAVVERELDCVDLRNKRELKVIGEPGQPRCGWIFALNFEVLLLLSETCTDWRRRRGSPKVVTSQVVELRIEMRPGGNETLFDY